MYDMGTDLSMAYNSVYEQPSPPPQQLMQPPPPMDLPLPKNTSSHQTPPDVVYNPPAAMYSQQTAAPPVMMRDSFWDKLGRRKLEVLKLVILSFVVLLGISMNELFKHYLTNYITKAFLSETQEFIVRLSYPIGVILVLWIIKAM